MTLEQSIKEIDRAFDLAYGHDETKDGAGEFLIRAAAKSIVVCYADSDSRAKAIALLIDAGWNLKKAEVKN